MTNSTTIQILTHQLATAKAELRTAISERERQLQSALAGPSAEMAVADELLTHKLGIYTLRAEVETLSGQLNRAIGLPGIPAIRADL